MLNCFTGKCYICYEIFSVRSVQNKRLTEIKLDQFGSGLLARISQTIVRIAQKTGLNVLQAPFQTSMGQFVWVRVVASRRALSFGVKKESGAKHTFLNLNILPLASIKTAMMA